MSKPKVERARNWSFLVYPHVSDTDGAPENWREILTDLHCQGCVSPLHDQDLDPDGKIKKAHYHVLLKFDGLKSAEQIKEITDKLNAPKAQKVNSLGGMIRYFLHLDNPDKHQYSSGDMTALGGLDFSTTFLKTSRIDKMQHLSDMMDLIDDQGFTEFTQFVRYCRKERFEDWFPLVSEKFTYLLIAYVKSNRFEKEEPND